MLKNARTVVVLALPLILLTLWFYARTARGEEHGSMAMSASLIFDEKCRIGDFHCNHAYFHDIYQKLELITGKTCCYGEDGRPTKDVKDATPEEKKQGFRYQVWVDGRWCPATENSLLRFTDEERKKLAKFPDKERLLRFLEGAHVFAPASTIDSTTGKYTCPPIYCLWKNPDPT